MIRGRFGDTTGRPYMEGLVRIPRLQRVGYVSFLLDTGADRSMLMPEDAINTLGIDYASLRTVDQTEGIGGKQEIYIESATLAFLDEGGIGSYSIDLQICEDADDTRKFPSILGRDIIDNWRITYSKPELALHADILQADAIIARR